MGASPLLTDSSPSTLTSPTISSTLLRKGSLLNGPPNVKLHCQNSRTTCLPHRCCLSPFQVRIYLSVSSNSLSAVLVWEVDGKQHPVYYVCRFLLNAESRYPQLEKLALVLAMASQKLKPYFQSHNITVVTISPLKVVLSRPDISSRLAKWAIELGEYG